MTLKAEGKVKRVFITDFGGNHCDGPGSQLQELGGAAQTLRFQELLGGLADLGAEKVRETGGRQAADGTVLGGSQGIRKVPDQIVHDVADAVIQSGLLGKRVLRVAPEQDLFQGIHREGFPVAQGSGREVVGIAEAGEDLLAYDRLAEGEAHQARRFFRPDQPGQPVGAGVKMGPEKLPVLP